MAQMKIYCIWATTLANSCTRTLKLEPLQLFHPRREREGVTPEDKKSWQKKLQEKIALWSSLLLFALTEIGKKAWLFAKLQPGRDRKRINAT